MNRIEVIKKRPVQTLVQSGFLAQGTLRSCVGIDGSAHPAPTPGQGHRLRGFSPAPSCAETREDTGTSEWSLLILFYGVLVSLKIFCCEKLQMDVNVLRGGGNK